MQISLPSGDRELVAFRAQVKLDIREPAPPPRTALTAGRSGPLRSIVSPRLSPDGRTLVFASPDLKVGESSANVYRLRHSSHPLVSE